VKARGRFGSRVFVAPSELEFGARIVAQTGPHGGFVYAVAGIDSHIMLDRYDVPEWQVWVESPFDWVQPTSEIWVVTASIAETLTPE
jgi:hypothetical protein